MYSDWLKLIQKHHRTIFFPECQSTNYKNDGNGFANISVLLQKPSAGQLN